MNKAETLYTIFLKLYFIISKLKLFLQKELLDDENLLVFLFHQIIFSSKLFQIFLVRLQFVKFCLICFGFFSVKFNLFLQTSDFFIAIYTFHNVAIAKKEQHNNHKQKNANLQTFKSQQSFFYSFCLFHYSETKMVCFIKYKYRRKIDSIGNFSQKRNIPRCKLKYTKKSYL